MSIPAGLPLFRLSSSGFVVTFKPVQSKSPHINPTSSFLPCLLCSAPILFSTECYLYTSVSSAVNVVSCAEVFTFSIQTLIFLYDTRHGSAPAFGQRL